MSTVSARQGLCLILLITPDSCGKEQWVVLGDAACAEAAPEVEKRAKGTEQSAAVLLGNAQCYKDNVPTAWQHLLCVITGYYGMEFGYASLAFGFEI